MLKKKVDVVEELLLKLFQIAILILMTVALLAVLVFGASAAYQALQTPKAPEPIRTTPEREISMDDVKRALQEEMQKDDPKKKDESEARPNAQVPVSLQYLEETTALYRCAQDFARRVGAQVDDEGNAVATQKVEGLRAQIEQLAIGNERGSAWVKSAGAFTCAMLMDKDIVVWARDAKLKGVFFKTLNIHRRIWDQIKQAKIKFALDEQNRFDAEVRAEATRVALAQASAMALLMMAGIAFGVFMVLAFYLLFSKIERSVRPEVRAARIPLQF